MPMPLAAPGLNGSAMKRASTRRWCIRMLPGCSSISRWMACPVSSWSMSTGNRSTNACTAKGASSNRSGAHFLGAGRGRGVCAQERRRAPRPQDQQCAHRRRRHGEAARLWHCHQFRRTTAHQHRQCGGHVAVAGTGAAHHRTCRTRSDIWALGIVFYELLTGAVPFSANAPGLLGERILKGIYTAPSALRSAIPRDVDRIVARCLRVRADDRYPDVKALLDDVRRLSIRSPAGMGLGAARLAPAWNLISEPSLLFGKSGEVARRASRNGGLCWLPCRPSRCCCFCS